MMFPTIAFPTISPRSLARATAAGLLALALGQQSGFAQTPETMRIRGSVISLDGSALTVKPRKGADVTIKLADNAKLIGVVKASISDIKPGAFIGTAAMPKEGSAARALEVVIFPEAMRGLGEGDSSWDLEQGSTMTNGTIAAAVEGMSGPTITVAYKGGERKITIGPDTPVVAFEGADISDIKPGAGIFTSARKQADGSWTTGFVAVGKNGVVPPM
jgi:hypothetical protein